MPPKGSKRAAAKAPAIASSVADDKNVDSVPEVSIAAPKRSKTQTKDNGSPAQLKKTVARKVDKKSNTAASENGNVNMATPENDVADPIDQPVVIEKSSRNINKTAKAGTTATKSPASKPKKTAPKADEAATENDNGNMANAGSQIAEPIDQPAVIEKASQDTKKPAKTAKKSPAPKPKKTATKADKAATDVEDGAGAIVLPDVPAAVDGAVPIKPIKKARAPVAKKMPVVKADVTPETVDASVDASVEPTKKSRAPKTKATNGTSDAAATGEVPAKKPRKTAAKKSANIDDDEVTTKTVPTTSRTKKLAAQNAAAMVDAAPIAVEVAKPSIASSIAPLPVAETEIEKPTKGRGKKPTAAVKLPAAAKATTTKRAPVKKPIATAAKFTVDAEVPPSGNGSSDSPVVTKVAAKRPAQSRSRTATPLDKVAKVSVTPLPSTEDATPADVIVAIAVAVETPPPAKRAKKPLAPLATNDDNNGVVPAQPANSTVTDHSEHNYELAADRPYTLKISSWNVAGLRAVVKKDGMQFLAHQKPDIFCMQEIKCLSDDVPAAAKVAGYHYYWNSRPGGHAGVALYSKTMPYNVHYGFDYDGKGQLKADGRLITAEYLKYFVVCVYVPNSGRQLVALADRLEWNKRFEAHLAQLNAMKPVIVCGDLNVSHRAIDLANPKTNTKSAGFTPEERAGMDDLLASGFVDTFRELYPDRVGAYTYWTYMQNARSRNVGWRLDYFLTSERIANKVVDNVICANVKGSDHCPITLFMNI